MGDTQEGRCERVEARQRHRTLGEAAAQDGRNNNFDAIRLLLAACVLVSHAWPMTTGTNFHEPFALWSGDRITLGGAALQLFFVLSGFLITKSWADRPGLGAYLRRRARRILPGYLAAYALSALLVASHPGGFNAHWRGLLRDALLFQSGAYPGVFPANPLPGMPNGAAWSLRYEEWCYALVAGLGMAGLCRPGNSAGRSTVAALLGGALFLAGGQQMGWWLTRHHDNFLLGDTFEWPRLLTHFLAGAFAYHWRDRIPLTPRLAAAAFGVAAVAPAVDGLLADFSSTHPMTAATPLSSVVWPLLGAYTALWAAYERRVPLQTWREWAGGDYSYGAYLYHWPAQMVLVSASPNLGAAGLVALSLPLTALCAWASWRFVESPALREGCGNRFTTAPTRVQEGGEGIAYHDHDVDDTRDDGRRDAPRGAGGGAGERPSG